LSTGTWAKTKYVVSYFGQVAESQRVDGQGGIDSTPCGLRQVCTDFDSGRVVDYTELDTASNWTKPFGASDDSFLGLLELANFF
jgi:hypothetical protein